MTIGPPLTATRPRPLPLAWFWCLPLAAGLLLAGGCRHRGPVPDLVTTPQLTIPADPVSLANFGLTHLLMQSPLRDFSRTHELAWGRASEVQSHPVAGPTFVELLRRLSREDHVAVSPAPARDWQLLATLLPATAAQPERLLLTLIASGSGTPAWSLELSLAQPAPPPPRS